MKSIRFVFTTALMTALMAMTAFAGDRFVGGTYINGINIAGRTVAEAKAYLEGDYSSNYKLTLTEKGGTETILGSEIGYKLTAPGNLQQILDDENAKNLVPSPVSKFEYTGDAAMQAGYSETALAAKIAALNVIKNTTKTSNAYITPYQAGQPYSVVKEVYGNSVDTAKLTATIKAALTGGFTDINLSNSGIYDTVTVTSAQLQELCGRLNQLNGMAITYNIAGNKEVLGADQIVTWITGSSGSTVTIDEAKAAAYVAALAARYDTAGGAQTWTSASGKNVGILTAYGFKINQAAETQALIQTIQGLKSAEREPVYVSRGAQWAMPQFGTTFVEVDLSIQHAYYYRNMQCVWDSAIVSGKASDPARATPLGVYSIQYKQRDRILKGPMKDGKPEYESHVNFWMPFNGGIGLHDADWRSSFGGNIYINNGSHGCINLPSAKAEALYGMIDKGTVVVVIG